MREDHDPVRNRIRDHLQLLEGVRAHHYPVSFIEEGVELLTGVAAGERDAEGNLPPDSVYGRVEAKLARMAEAAKDKKESEVRSQESEENKENKKEAPS